MAQLLRRRHNALNAGKFMGGHGQNPMVPAGIVMLKGDIDAFLPGAGPCRPGIRGRAVDQRLQR